MTATETAVIEKQPVDTIVPDYFSKTRRRTLFKNEPKERQLGPHGSSSSFLNSQGLRIASYYWPADGKVKAVVVFVHGHGAYLMHELLHIPTAGMPPQYSKSWVEVLNKAGFSVCGIDQQGCGFSEGLECYVERFHYYVDDVLQFARSLNSCTVKGFSGKQMFIAGCSLGGCISVNAICREGKLFKGAALFAPMLSLERASQHGLNYYLRPLAALLSYVWPTLPAASTTKNDQHPELQALWDEDPLCWHGATRARVAHEYLLAAEAGLKAMNAYTFPFIVFHGGDDTLTDPDGSKKLYERSQSKDKTFRLMPGRWHVLLKEPGNDVILKEVISWMTERVK
ncbi:g957 [Coccomyxa viridis]|uniref:G957 protein n=1 Tax=Coccomyxa viridis TaxID=1274662 RepID=A0ABP1FGW5_9CHLO